MSSSIIELPVYEVLSGSSRTIVCKEFLSSLYKVFSEPEIILDKAINYQDGYAVENTVVNDQCKTDSIVLDKLEETVYIGDPISFDSENNCTYTGNPITLDTIEDTPIGSTDDCIILDRIDNQVYTGPQITLD